MAKRVVTSPVEVLAPTSTSGVRSPRPRVPAASTRRPGVAAPDEPVHVWTFRASFRKRAFGWRSATPIQALREAVAEIKRVARAELATAAEGAVLLIERLPPALEQVDGSSGGMGAAVVRALDELVPVLAAVSVEDTRRQAWLERLWQAVLADEKPTIEALIERWGEVCATGEMASVWADRFLPLARQMLGPRTPERRWVPDSVACLSALFRAGRHAEILALLEGETFWPCKRWEVLSRAAQGDIDGALACAEAARSPWTNATDLAQLCERILLDAGRTDEAFSRHAIAATTGGTYLATFRALARKYPGKTDRERLDALVASTPGQEGKWFTAAKDAGLLEEALALASRTPCDPLTLARAARDHVTSHPSFALRAGMLALDGLAQGLGYEVTADDVRLAFDFTLQAAEALGTREPTRAAIRQQVEGHGGGANVVTRVLGHRLRPLGS